MLRTGNRETCLVVMIFGCVGGILISDASCRADARVEGDAALLSVIREGLATAITQHRRGSLVAKVVERRSFRDDDSEIHEHVSDGEIHEHVWDGDRRYWRYSGQTVYRAPEKPEEIKPYSNIEKILRPDLSCWYFPDTNYAKSTRNPKELRLTQPGLELHPVRCWYSYNRGKTTWNRMLDPSFHKSVSQFEVEKAGSDRVVILRHQPQGLLRVEVSLAHGGNIVSYRAEADEWIKSGTYDWVEYSPGNWRLKETVQEQVSTSDPDTPQKYYRLEILEFDPQPRIPAGRFQSSSFNLAEGTTFRKYDVQGNRILGGKGGSLKTPDQENLDELADQLRSDGSAAPERAP